MCSTGDAGVDVSTGDAARDVTADSNSVDGALDAPPDVGADRPPLEDGADVAGEASLLPDAPAADGPPAPDGTSPDVPAMVCAPGSATCASVSARRVCNADGLGTTTSPCGTYEDCAAGACVGWPDIFAAYAGPVGWDVAQADCARRGGDLARIDSEAENGAASMACEAAAGGPGRDTGCWLGAQAPFTSWHDGRAVAYTRWAPGQPSREPFAICLWMYNGRSASSRPITGRWDDQACTTPVSYLCRLSDPERAAGAVAIVRAR